ncbi:MAG: integral membrane protein [Akkermansiaceae bacterium]|jgi:integral membrane protein
MFQYPLGFLRLFSLLDGLSFIILLYFAIYEKRILGDETAVRIPGMIHGIIFTIFLVLLFLTMVKRKWPLKRAALVFVCSLIPLAPFFLEQSLKKEQEGP